MTKNEWVSTCNSRLADRCIKNFSALEISDVGRVNQGVSLSAPPLWMLSNAYRLIDVLEWVREEGGVAPVLINSWFRDADYNRVVGGVSNSMHLTLGAADIVKIGTSPSELADLIEGHPQSDLLGLGRYNTFTHVDIRGMIGRSAPARWVRT